jgi:hypothetical protein
MKAVTRQDFSLDSQLQNMHKDAYLCKNSK